MSELNLSMLEVPDQVFDENRLSSSMLVLTDQSSTTPSSPTSDLMEGLMDNFPLSLLLEKEIKKLKEEMNFEKLQDATQFVENMSREDLTKKDDNGDTVLLLLLSNRDEFTKKKELFIPLVEKISNVIPQVLNMKNCEGETALYLAGKNFPKNSSIFGYLAGKMLLTGLDINKQCDKSGNTMLHRIAALGDSHTEILQKLFMLLKFNFSLYFQSNNNNETALHVAIKHHCDDNNSALNMARMLLQSGLDSTAIDKDGNTALHLAVSLHCDPDLVKVLLEFSDPKIVKIKNNSFKMPLHLVQEVPDTIDLEKRIEVCRLLIDVNYKMYVKFINMRA